MEIKTFELTIEDVDRIEFCLTGLRHLVPQLYPERDRLSYDELFDLIESDKVSMVFAIYHDEIVGVLTMVTLNILSGTRSWIEDVIVDDPVRGMGIGQALYEAALELADEKGSRTVNLISNPSRESSNRLYQRLGFDLMDHNLYRFNL